MRPEALEERSVENGMKRAGAQADNRAVIYLTAARRGGGGIWAGVGRCDRLRSRQSAGDGVV